VVRANPARRRRRRRGAWSSRLWRASAPNGYAQAARTLSTGDITADPPASRLDLPIQVIVGEAGVVTPPAVNLDIAAVCPAALIHVIPGAGHALYLEKP
jgi:pimeloyl-ACP methyl ester carboxylesterase